MSIELTCPKCHVTQRVPDKAAGQTKLCPNCQAEFSPEPELPEPEPRKRWFLWLLLVLILVGGGVAAYFFLQRPTPTDFTDPNGIFSARFPNVPEAETVSKANPMMLL